MDRKSELIREAWQEFNRWQELISRLIENTAAKPQTRSDLSFKDILAHLKVWQEISIARLQAGLLDEEPVLPVWPAGLDHDADEDLDKINAWIDETNKALSFTEVQHSWAAGFQRFIALADSIPADDLFSLTKFTWLPGYSLFDVIEGSLEHHLEHRETLEVWFNRNVTR